MKYQFSSYQNKAGKFVSVFLPSHFQRKRCVQYTFDLKMRLAVARGCSAPHAKVRDVERGYIGDGKRWGATEGESKKEGDP